MTSLRDSYDALVFDLDGVIYRGPEPVAHAITAVEAARSAGLKVAYATNNASRPPAQVAQHLRDLGLTLDDNAVVNSSMAGAAFLAQEIEQDSLVLAVGGEGVRIALVDKGFEVATGHPKERPAAVLQGYGPQVTAQDLADAAYAIQGGARWVATNTDLTLPTALGTAPGNGSLVAAVRAAVDHDPDVVGKPGPLMYTMAAEILGVAPEKTLGVGDRLETDVAGAAAAGMDCLHVLTGVHGPADLIAAPAELRPRFVAEDLRALDQNYTEPQQDSGSWSIGSARAHLDDVASGPRLRIEGTDDSQERLRLALAVLWEAVDTGRIDSAKAVNCWVTSK